MVASIVASRTAKGAFADFADFLRKVDAVVCNKRTIEALIKAGAFDSLGHARRGLLMVYEPAVDAVVDTKRNEANGQFDLFGFGDLETPASDTPSMFDVHVGDEEWDKPVLLAFEREMLGLYVSDHPLLGVEHILAAAADTSIATLQSEQAEGLANVTIAGILSSVSRRVTKAGAPWARATLEDLEGSIEVLFFPATYAQVGLQVVEDALVVLKGRPQARDDTRRADRLRPDPARSHRPRAGPGRGQRRAGALHPAAGRAAARGAGRPPGHHRGAPAAGERRAQPEAAPG